MRRSRTPADGGRSSRDTGLARWRCWLLHSGLGEKEVPGYRAEGFSRRSRRGPLGRGWTDTWVWRRGGVMCLKVKEVEWDSAGAGSLMKVMVLNFFFFLVVGWLLW